MINFHSVSLRNFCHACLDCNSIFLIKKKQTFNGLLQALVKSIYQNIFYLS